MLGIVFFVYNVDLFKLSRWVYFLIVLISLLSKPNDLLHTSNCPNCFDNDQCESIANGGIELHWLSKFLLILNPKLTKSVFFGKLNNSIDVVLKSMTRRSQTRVKHKLVQLDDIIKDNVLISDNDIRNVVLCPNVRSFNLLFDNVDENITNLALNRNLWLDVEISIEPLLLKFLSPIEGMPVPNYIGACGDIILKEFKGKPLNNYYHCDSKTRAFLSIQLLKMAETFTFHHESLIFYFTDISSDNIAVDRYGTIYLTDLDHVIIAERMLNHSGDSLGKGRVHVSAVVDPVKLTISPSDICKYPVSDHNYFAVCKTILMYTEEMDQGLLHDVTRENRSNLEELLEECSLPRKYDNRIIAGRLLRKGLSEAIRDFSWKENS